MRCWKNHSKIFIRLQCFDTIESPVWKNTFGKALRFQKSWLVAFWVILNVLTFFQLLNELSHFSSSPFIHLSRIGPLASLMTQIIFSKKWTSACQMLSKWYDATITKYFRIRVRGICWGDLLLLNGLAIFICFICSPFSSDLMNTPAAHRSTIPKEYAGVIMYLTFEKTDDGVIMDRSPYGNNAYMDGNAKIVDSHRYRNYMKFLIRNPLNQHKDISYSSLNHHVNA